MMYPCMLRRWGYTIFKEVSPPPGTVLMKRARRGKPPATQLSREITEVEEEEVIVVLESVCGGATVDVVSSPEDAADDRKTLAELGIVIGGKEEGNKAEGGQGREKVGGPRLDLILREVSKKKRGPTEVASPEPPAKRGKGAEEGLLQKGVMIGNKASSPLKALISSGSLGTKIQGLCVYRGEVGLALGSGLVSKGLEEKLERTLTPELYSGFANKIATILTHLPVALNRALRTEEQVLEQGRQLHQRDEEVEALRVQLAMKQERLDGIRRAWEGLASTLIHGGKITVANLGEVDPFLAWPPISFMKKKNLT
ncbi:hypothetical protein AXF42_Ash003928 [Apostasia shenzhenica]|uniref:Uncharacterized protein n=1 Tax=Apostasia shenzhenica TaxID=1088818 RepID=A0A2I0AIC7_9ASPA|nr:hypothetical protein AXF42_Ash003928 [Apostasia shenzhenica]